MSRHSHLFDLAANLLSTDPAATVGGLPLHGGGMRMHAAPVKVSAGIWPWQWDIFSWMNPMRNSGGGGGNDCDAKLKFVKEEIESEFDENGANALAKTAKDRAIHDAWVSLLIFGFGL